MSGVTDSLIKLSKEVSLEQDPSEREMDVLLSTGEQTTIALTAMAINGLGRKAVSLTGAQAGIITDGVHTKAKISNLSPRKLHGYLNDVGVDHCGRYGDWAYLWTDDSFKSGERAAESALARL